MPRYFFQITDDYLTPDLEGMDLTDLDAARHVAVDIAADLLKSSRDRFWRTKILRLEVIGADGTALLELTVNAVASSQATTIPGTSSVATG